MSAGSPAVRALGLPRLPRELRGRPRDSVVLLLLDDAECTRCAEYAAKLAAARDEILAPWDAALRVIDRADRAGAAPLWADGGQVRLVVADRFGEAFAVYDGHETLPEPRALEEWLRYLATQCPE